MTLFFLIFFALYSLMHSYLFLRIRAAFALSPPASLTLVFCMAALVFTPYFIRVAERFGLEAMARALSFSGYLWMGFLLLFVSAAAAVDVYRAVLAAAQAAGRPLTLPAPTPLAALIIPFCVALAASVYGYAEARNIRVEHHAVRTTAIPTETGRIRIVQISDVHLGLIVRHERLKAILTKVKEAGPDLLVSTGDLVDGQINNLNGLSDMFREIEPRYGKYAVTGNHEVYAGLQQALEFTEKAGFIVLRDESVSVAGVLQVAGVDDPAISQRTGAARKANEDSVLRAADQGRFVLLLKHRPLFPRESIGRFDLQLSGHVHRGQIFPFSILTAFYYPVHSGFVRLSDRSAVSVSRGSGTWGPPMRILSPPEVTVIDLVPG
ncbi:MAG: metallophosphoesterase [Thermodesulfovibrionales bacterium]